jgi:hypothetical protein
MRNLKLQRCATPTNCTVLACRYFFLHRIQIGPHSLSCLEVGGAVSQYWHHYYDPAATRLVLYFVDLFADVFAGSSDSTVSLDSTVTTSLQDFTSFFRECLDADRQHQQQHIERKEEHTKCESESPISVFSTPRGAMTGADDGTSHVPIVFVLNVSGYRRFFAKAYRNDETGGGEGSVESFLAALTRTRLELEERIRRSEKMILQSLQLQFASGQSVEREGNVYSLDFGSVYFAVFDGANTLEGNPLSGILGKEILLALGLA